MSYDLMFQQALALHEQGRFDEAESLYRQILETAPRNPDVLNLLGLVAQAKGIHNEAVELFYKAVCEAPTHAPFYFNLALSLDLWDKPHEALDNYRKALKIDPGIKEAWNNIGTLCQKLGQAAEAETAYRRAAALDSEYAEPRVNLARMKKDLSELKALAKRFPHDALSLYFLADEHYRAGEYDLAAEYAAQASANAPTDAEIKILSGLICLAQENTAEARICFQKALALDPRSVPALVNLANLETTAGEYETAEKHYKRALELSPQNLDAHINYADMLYRQKRLPEALEEYRTAVVIDPGIPEISNNLGVILKDIGEYEEALGLFFNAFNQRPETGEFSVNIAETLTLLHGQNPKQPSKLRRTGADRLRTTPLPSMSALHCRENWKMKIIRFMLKSFLTILLIITSWFSKSLITALSEALETLRDLLKAPLWILAAARGLLAWLIRPLAPGLSAWISPKKCSPRPAKKESTKN